MSQILREYGIHSVDFLKVDIEGSEFDLFNAGSSIWRNLVSRLAMEVHPFYGDPSSLIAVLEAAGFAVQYPRGRLGSLSDASDAFVLHGWKEGHILEESV